MRRRPNVAVRFKLLIKRRVGLTLGLGRSLMHGVAPQMCGSSNQPIVRPRSRGSLPSYLCRLDWRPGTKCCFTCERARGALAYLRGRVPGRGLQFAADSKPPLSVPTRCCPVGLRDPHPLMDRPPLARRMTCLRNISDQKSQRANDLIGGAKPPPRLPAFALATLHKI